MRVYRGKSKYECGQRNLHGQLAVLGHTEWQVCLVLVLVLVPGLIACRNSNYRSSLISIGNFIQLPLDLDPQIRTIS